MNAPKDSRTHIGLLQCQDGTAAIMGKPHTKAKRAMAIPSGMATILLTKEAGEALYELLGDWLGKRREGHGELDYDGPESAEDEGYSFDPAELQRQAGHG